jgi:hypothetical protein
MTQGRAKKKKPMTEETVCVGVDVAKGTLDIGSSILGIAGFDRPDDESP